MDYSTWVGKKVYVSGDSLLEATRYKNEKNEDYSGKFIRELSGNEYPIVITNGIQFRFAVLADEEEKKPVTVYPCRMYVSRTSVEEALTNNGDRLVLGYFNGLYVAVHVDDEDAYYKYENYSVVTWKYAVPIPAIPKLTKKEICEKFGIENFELVEE